MIGKKYNIKRFGAIVFLGLTLSAPLVAQNIKSEASLDSLYIGMSADNVRVFFGEPIHEMAFIKTSIFWYNFKKPNGELAEYRIYFANDTVCKLTELVNKKEVQRPITGTRATYNTIEDKRTSYYKGFVLEGKSLVITKIIENVALSEDQLFDALLTGISRACNGSQGEFKMKEPSHILYHGIIDKIITFDGRWGSINVFYSIDIAIKKGRLRIKAIGEEIDWRQDQDKLTYYFADVIPFGETLMNELSVDESIKMADNTIEKFNQYISVIQEEITRKSNDDW